MEKLKWPDDYHRMLLNQAEQMLTDLNDCHDTLSAKRSVKSGDYNNNLLGAGIILGISNLILEPYENLKQKQKFDLKSKFGQKVNNTYWANLIVSAGNWTRHSSDWRKPTYNYLSDNNFFDFLVNKNIENSNEFLKYFDGEKAKSNLNVFLLADVPLRSFILAGNNYWNMTKLLRLNEKNYTLTHYEAYLKSLSNTLKKINAPQKTRPRPA